MNLREYLKELQELVNKNPQALDYKVIYAKDDEGNEYSPVSYSPTVGFYDPEEWKFDVFPCFDDIVLNAVCVN